MISFKVLPYYIYLSFLRYSTLPICVMFVTFWEKIFCPHFLHTLCAFISHYSLFSLLVCFKVDINLSRKLCVWTSITTEHPQNIHRTSTSQHFLSNLSKQHRQVQKSRKNQLQEYSSPGHLPSQYCCQRPYGICPPIFSFWWYSQQCH